MRFADIGSLLFSPRGSISRLYFFIGYLSINVIALITFFVFTASSNSLMQHLAKNTSISTMAQTSPNKFLITLGYEGIFVPLIISLIVLALTWAHICLIIKRLRDLNVSTWLVVFPYATYCLTIYIQVLQQMYPYMYSNWNLCKYLSLFFMIAFFGILLFWPSRRGV